MNKQDLVAIVKSLKADLAALKKKLPKFSGKQINNKKFLTELEVLATTWFEKIEAQLRGAVRLDDAILSMYHDQFAKMLELSGLNPAKTTVQTVLETTFKSFHSEIVVPVLKHQEAVNKFPKLGNLLSHVTGLEHDYLSEAIDCANLEKFRASIILGWCATIGRLHGFIEKEGFHKLNKASKQMTAITTGRYKRFNSTYDIQNLSDLRMTVFDRQLLWILEFLGDIDGNQHERLGICLTVRDTCAHPGEATISEENLLSFFSDIDTMIFSNPKFALPPGQTA
jgi:hypothetical protein